MSTFKARQIQHPNMQAGLWIFVMWPVLVGGVKENLRGGEILTYLVNEVKSLKQEVSELKEDRRVLKNAISHLTQKETEVFRNPEVFSKVRSKKQLSPPVAFSARLKNDIISVADHEKLPFNDVITNIGNGYHNFSGIFFCSQPGIYVFFVNLETYASMYVHVAIVKNGNELVRADANSISSGHTNNGSNMVTVVLAAGDQVWVRVQAGEHSIGGGQLLRKVSSSFSGFLLR